MGEADLVGIPAATPAEKPEGVLLLYRQREISDASLSAFVDALLAELQRDELHIDLVGDALVRCGFIREPPTSAALGQEEHDERAAALADVMMERMCDDLVLRGALTKIAGDVLAKLTSPATITDQPRREGATPRNGRHAGRSRVPR
jgi:hypothetical protein